MSVVRRLGNKHPFVLIRSYCMRIWRELHSYPLCLRRQLACKVSFLRTMSAVCQLAVNKPRPTKRLSRVQCNEVFEIHAAFFFFDFCLTSNTLSHGTRRASGSFSPFGKKMGLSQSCSVSFDQQRVTMGSLTRAGTSGRNFVASCSITCARRKAASCAHSSSHSTMN